MLKFLLVNQLENQLNNYLFLDIQNPYLYQNAQKNIRNVLLDLIEDGKGRRIRTDVDGYAKIADMKAGSFFITGTATLGKVGVTWDVPVRLVSGNNKISLTLENSAWSL